MQKGIMGRSNAPLLILLILPFYTLPGAQLRIAQMQFFQLFAIVLYALSPQHAPGSKWYCPARWAVFFSILALTYHPLNIFLLTQLQMVCLTYVLFETTVRSNVSMRWFMVVLKISLLITVGYCIMQYFHIPHLKVWGLTIPPEYVLAPRLHYIMHGHWGAQAFCAFFLALSIPFFLIFSRWWTVVPIALLGLLQSSIAIGAAALSIIFLSWHYQKRFFWAVVITLISLAIAFFFFVDYGSFGGRWFVWTEAIKEGMKHPWLGTGYGSFWTWSAPVTLTRLEPYNYFWAEAHNVYLQSWFEMGFVGIIFWIGLFSRIIWCFNQDSDDQTMQALMGGLIVCAATAFGQPILHTVVTTSWVVIIYATFEARHNELNNYNYQDGSEL